MFNHANLKQVFVRSEHLERISLFNADLRGTDLSNARGLTQAQLNSAIIDEHTILPDYLKKPQAGS
jgi:uncharacterized protein YjbI with pentapeptide repeats